MIDKCNANIKCRNEDCAKVFANASKRLRHVKNSGYLPRRKSSFEIIDEWWLDEAEANDEECSQLNTFMEIYSLAASVSDNSSEPICFVKIHFCKYKKQLAVTLILQHLLKILRSFFTSYFKL